MATHTFSLSWLPTSPARCSPARSAASRIAGSQVPFSPSTAGIVAGIRGSAGRWCTAKVWALMRVFASTNEYLCLLLPTANHRVLPISQERLLLPVCLSAILFQIRRHKMTEEDYFKAAGFMDAPVSSSGEDLKSHFRTHLLNLRKVWIEEAMSHMEQSMRSRPGPGEPGEGNPDWYSGGPNIIGLAMIEAGFASVAVDLFREARLRAVQYRNETGDHRHVGALVAHEAQAYGMMNDFDGAALCLLYGSQEDTVTYNAASRHETFGFKVIWEQMMRSKLLARCLPLVQAVEPATTLEELDAAFRALDDFEFPLMIACHTLLVHTETLADFDNILSRMRIVGALRDLSALLEITIKGLVPASATTSVNAVRFFRALRSLYGSARWWILFDQEARSCGTMPDSGVASGEQVRRALALRRPDADARFWTSLIVSYAVRNYTVHELDVAGPLVVPATTEEILGHILNVLVQAPKRV